MQLRKARLFSPWLDAADASPATTQAAGTLVSAPGLTRYHRAECPSVAGLPVSPVDRRSLPAGLAPCRLCDPDTPAG